MSVIIYHGSENIIECPVYGAGALHNDYGRGFYCTKNVELAKEWACGRGNNGYANKYELNMEGLKVLELNKEPYSILNWLAVLAKNRTYWQNSSISATAKEYLQDNFYVDTTKYDVIIGYRADDSYFTFAQDFVAGTISLKTLSAAMRLGELGEQIVLVSKKAFSKIKYIDNEVATADKYFELKNARDKKARLAYRKQKNTKLDPNDIFMIDIMREGIKNGDPRIQ
ncbi:DUF3990 domain-containing protein [Butyrivibrio sp. AC2005]|uniref:DUF3990 domain-containing protein n=1 Tax=Butyrivibrio sp. AC2005 TaxID=1280672 RepID=UPI0004176952|nr:DUF3990 domain-containing protein [Butyrivibrio sp. AC2005]